MQASPVKGSLLMLDRSSVSSECNQVYTKVWCHAAICPAEGCSFPLYSSPSPLCRSVAGAGRLLSYSTFTERVSFCLAEHRQLPLLTHTELVCTALLPHYERQDCPNTAQLCAAQYFWQPHQIFPLTVIFRSPQTWNKCSSHTLHPFPTELSIH